MPRASGDTPCRVGGFSWFPIMKTLRVKWTGIRPLLMHNAAMIDPDNEHVRAKSELQSLLKAAKKDDYTGREVLRRKIERTEWEGSLYWNDDMGLYVPGTNIFKCIVEGARKIPGKAGKRAEAAIVPIDDTKIETAAPYPRDLNKLYATAQFSLRQAVRIPPRTGARMMAVRPLIPTGWWFEFDVEFDEKELPEKDLIDACVTSGSLIGVCDWRPRFGRFQSEVVK